MGILRLQVVVNSLMGGPGLRPRPMPIRGRKRLVGPLEPRQAVHNGVEWRRWPANELCVVPAETLGDPPAQTATTTHMIPSSY